MNQGSDHPWHIATNIPMFPHTSHVECVVWLESNR
ncbi:hypothetical protein FHS18_004058 [Paenibacillus phyllosphaerae]|uniref:Uncharacterized protein n=1 Tax=Paenibacillus phyllosphaerae TaxID=274593 RepID=A0A7W5B039_9BACL|nr:hypothetical protein [Paenibacillus phyllosphaerae]